jgi:hypothetical protein
MDKIIEEESTENTGTSIKENQQLGANRRKKKL